MAEEFETRPSLLDAFGGKPTDPPASVPAMSGTVMPFARMGAVKVEVKRNEREILQQLKFLAERAGEEWFYRWPNKEKKTGRTSWTEGPTIKLTNEVWRLYGNIDIRTEAIDIGDSWMIKAIFFDKETGSSMERIYQQRKSQRTMGEDVERQRDAAFQIGQSKAIRNVIRNALEGICDFAFEEAKNSLVGRVGKDLPRWRENTVKKLETKVDLKRAEAVVGRAANEWLAPDIAQLLAMMKSVSEGMATIDETFPPLGKPEEKEPPSKIDQFAKEEEREPGEDG